MVDTREVAAVASIVLTEDGHAGARLYPTTLVEEYRKTVRATYVDFHGADSLRAPDAEEWRRFSQTLELRAGRQDAVRACELRVTFGPSRSPRRSRRAI